MYWHRTFIWLGSKLITLLVWDVRGSVGTYLQLKVYMYIMYISIMYIFQQILCWMSSLNVFMVFTFSHYSIDWKDLCGFCLNLVQSVNPLHWTTLMCGSWRPELLTATGPHYAKCYRVLATIDCRYYIFKQRH